MLTIVQSPILSADMKHVHFQTFYGDLVVTAAGSVSLSKRIAQKQMAPTAFNPDECAPSWLLWRKNLPRDKSRSLRRIVAAGNLGSERQEQFIQTLFGEEVSHQLWPTLDQNDVTLTSTANCIQDRPSTG